MVCPEGESGSIRANRSGSARCITSRRPGDAVVCIAPSPGSGLGTAPGTALSVDGRDGISNRRSRQSGSQGDPHATRDSPYPLRTHQQPDNLGLAGTAYDRHAFTAQPVCRDHSDARIRHGRRTIREQIRFIEFLFDLARISVGCCRKDTQNIGSTLTSEIPFEAFIIVSPLPSGYWQGRISRRTQPFRGRGAAAGHARRNFDMPGTGRRDSRVRRENWR